MKKWWLIILIALLVLVLCSYLIIPNTVSIHQGQLVHANSRSVQRVMMDEKKWKEWWPGKTQLTSSGPIFTYNGYTYSIVDRKLTTIDFSVADGSFSTNVSLNFIPLSADSVAFTMVGEKTLPATPAKRLQYYFKTTQLSKDFTVLLQNMQAFYSNADNIYDVHIEKALVVDSTLITTSATSKGQPTVESVYALIEKLKNYAAAQGASQTGYPMLNIRTTDSINFLTRVAIPVNKKLPSSGDIEYRWMLGGGNILITEVKGGPAALNAALLQMETYISDHNRVAPAIPFQSLITDRSKENDTSKWITRIYYPVM